MGNDDYPTCAHTFVTLRIYHPSADPKSVTNSLGVEPTEHQRFGEPIGHLIEPSRTYKLSGWFYSSEGSLESCDAAKHLAWLLERFDRHQHALAQLREQGWRMDISCYWESKNGHGGPTLSPPLLLRLAALGIELWFDVYFPGDPVPADDSIRRTP